MRKADKLKQEAKTACQHRGHDMSNFKQFGSYYISHCKKCDKQAVVNTNPRPNEIDISGQAVALNCK